MNLNVCALRGICFDYSMMMCMCGLCMHKICAVR